MILDPGSTITITNDESRLFNIRLTENDDFVWSGDRQLPVTAYGTMLVKAGKHILHLEDVALCPSLLTTLVSLRQLRRKGYYWDNEHDPTTLRRRDKSIVCEVQDMYGQYVLEFRKECYHAALTTYRKKHSSWTERKPLVGDAWLWHGRLGHPGPQALEHLVNSSQGVRLRGPTTVECEACALAKITRQIRRFPRDIQEQEGERIALDFHDYEEGLEGYSSQMLLYDRISGFIWDFYLKDREDDTIISALRSFLGIMRLHYETNVKVIECDNEITDVKPQVQAFLEDRHIKVEPSAPYSQAQNGGAERSGGEIKTKGRAMRLSSKLPNDLWPEIAKTSVYLHNRTPSYRLDWKTPYHRFHTAIARRLGISKPEWQPNQSHLRVFGCKAYAMNTETHTKSNRKQRYNPRAWIGYLVGYKSSNIWRIWVPSEGRIINTRDVIFNEKEFFNGSWDGFQDEMFKTDIAGLAKWIQEHALPEDEEEVTEPQVEDVQEGTLPEQTAEDAEELVEAAEDSTDGGQAGPFTTSKFVPLPTPPRTPPSALLANTIQTVNDSGSQPKVPEKDHTVPWQAAFLAGMKSAPMAKHNEKVLDKASVERLLRQGVKIHRRNLPPPPRWHRDLKNHVLGGLFEDAEKDHLKSHEDMKSWTEIRTRDPQAEDKQILDCMWVYVYKFDKHGRFLKCKARLVVRGDQQAKSQTQETYAATLAGRSFRTLIAIAARFDLELIQYDVVNAFVHAHLDQDIFMRMPQGYRKPGTILKLNKALYGLRISPLLWQKVFTKTLQECGFDQVPHEPCCFIKGGVLVFFYVDDIIIAHRSKDKPAVDELVWQLKKTYNISGGDAAQWFLGMEILRDRTEKKIWLSQAAYIDKIAKLVDKHSIPHSVPMSTEELKPRKDLATPKEIQRYQRKIGSLLFAAVSTRPDVAFATSRLARFLNNPSEKHQDAADRVLLYLQSTRTLALAFGNGDDLKVASDASFADNTLDRKSSQAFAMRLFGGLIGWRANKQDTVTTSTTEAELLALAQAAKETLFISRLLTELSVLFDDKSIIIECDNKQTINLVNAEIATLKTQLRHVDIHNHWLRQEVERGSIKVEYTPSAEMIADGLTKALPKPKWAAFLKQIGLEDIQSRQTQGNFTENPILDRLEAMH